MSDRSPSPRGYYQQQRAYDSEERMDVDDEIDELLSGDEGDGGDGGDDRDDDGDEGDEGDGEVNKNAHGARECLWDDCAQAFGSQDALVQHVTTYHIGSGRQPYACLWRTCPRAGQKQASRHALLTHIRSHTGEKPYACPEPGCGRQFTRSDAMNKHVRAIHGPSSKKRRGEEPISGPGIEDEPTTADRELAKDEDLADVVIRLRARDRIHFKPNADEAAALLFVRESRPGGAPTKTRGRRRAAGSDSDEFDEGAGKKYPVERNVEGYMMDAAGEHEVPVMGRSRWQVKYVMAKAKLMLVDEENKMRRDELAFWLGEEERVFGRSERGPEVRGDMAIEMDRERQRQRHLREPPEASDVDDELYEAAMG